MRKMPLYQLIATTIQAHENCAVNGNSEWKIRHRETLDYIERNFLPSGAGIDSGTRIDFDRTTGDKLILTFGFHHMNDGGYYDGWTEHSLTVRPSLTQEIDLNISGRDRNEIKEYLYDTYYWTLRRIVEWDEAAGCWKFTPEPSAESFDVPPVNTVNNAEAFAGA